MQNYTGRPNFSPPKHIHAHSTDGRRRAHIEPRIKNCEPFSSEYITAETISLSLSLVSDCYLLKILIFLGAKRYRAGKMSSCSEAQRDYARSVCMRQGRACLQVFGPSQGQPRPACSPSHRNAGLAAHTHIRRRLNACVHYYIACARVIGLLSLSRTSLSLQILCDAHLRE